MFTVFLSHMYIGTSVAVDLLRIIAVIGTIWGVRSIQLKPLHYLILLAAGDIAYAWGMQNCLGDSVTYLVLYLLLVLFARQMKNSGVEILLTWCASILVFVTYQFVFYHFLREAYYEITWHYGMRPFQKVVLLGVMAGMLVAMICIMIFLLKKMLGFYLEQWKEFSGTYRELEHYLLLVPLILWIPFLVREGMENYVWGYQEVPEVRLAVDLFLLAFVLTQIFYLRLLIRTITMRERLRQEELRKDQMALYDRDLQENIQAIREMKHDLKNVFLTMGEYVDRSEDEELRDYYYEKIAPYAKNEIQRNDLYVQLQELENESLKAFLYYKIQQGIQLGIQMKLETKLDHSMLLRYEWKTSLWRILGVFLDNAIEECEKIPEGQIVIRITEQEQKLCFQIKNQVTEESRRNGIREGVSTKGLGRGNGLCIVERLVKQNKNIVWNSYFQESYFVQSILLT